MKLSNVIFYVKNINAAVEFYQKLGFQVVTNEGKFINFKTDDERVYFSIMESSNPRAEIGHQVCAFWSNNVSGLYEKFKLLAVPIDTTLTESHYGKKFAIRDYDGNKIEFIQDSKVEANPDR